MRWRGLLETFGDVEADNEEEAMEKMAEVLISHLKSGDSEFIVWPLNEPSDDDHNDPRRGQSADINRRNER